ncbi:MAG: hypothetical protein JKY17_03360 [Magnetovibrio sp.]|nr:hypothetical protein [Magnetovibrio sp.]
MSDDLHLKTDNPDWGFFGAIRDDNVCPEEAWGLAMTTLTKETAYCAEDIRTFLDSRYGRHFADDVKNILYQEQPLYKAINAATKIWMGWTITRRIQNQVGIPVGLPYLTGIVGHAVIGVEAH